jgi:sodium/bile acid cotransporter 7
LIQKKYCNFLASETYLLDTSTLANTKTDWSSLLKKAGIDNFMLALFSAVFLAYLYPFAGSDRSPFPLGEIANWGVALIFFFYGLKLSPQDLKAGLSNWKLHFVVQAATFLLFPLIAFGLKPFFTAPEDELLWIGILFLCALPSTVSSSVVMVSIANGNLPAAIFNASISSLIGVFITPLWMTLVIDNIVPDFDMTGVLWKLTLQVLLPITLGLVFHKSLGGWAARNKTNIKYFDQTIIVLIVYSSFCESFEQRLFSTFSVSDILLLSAGMITLFFVVFAIIKLICGMLNFSREDSITAVFCGSKKSLVQGAVMLKVLFPDSMMAGIILLPIMIYHALQLLIVSIIAQKLSREQ